MNKRITLLITLISLSFASEITDYQFWHSEKLSTTLGEQSKITLDIDSRFRDHGSEQYYFHGDLRYHYKVRKGFDLAISFREIYSNKNGLWVNEHRPNGEFKLSHTFGKHKFSWRNRFEYRIFADDTATRNRALFTVSHPLTKLPKASFYIADEIFYDFTSSKLNANRLYLGLNFGKIAFIKVSAYSMWQSSLKNEEWSVFQVSGIKLSF